ncbi:phospholipase A2 inhibitor and Ly6/PLAUR domain-containing protein-like [Betta splendens]|uniref:Phospholipase A2 inhibitor and Ly6/PLAUR domain-containing protein-like n=1 Tax=Betta splendens TaxID=158456 RepID=A0A9W2XQC4_BETSP|nr:phospholipase A2 inhibitor and Ly6/PLAUR domain-containing protein-like [Betta splendens]
MKMILPLTLMVTLFSTAGALKCETCTNTQCSSTAPVTCTSETMCVTASIQATSSGTTVPQIFKACASSSLCPAAGTQTFSLDLRASSAVASAHCCNTDNCNSATLPFKYTRAFRFKIQKTLLQPDPSAYMLLFC